MKIVADYQKRTGETPADQRQKLTFVFATPRRVRGKPKWTKKHPDEWRKIRILDAVNLEEWLEIAPSVSLWLAEKMGKNIDGFRSLDSEWDRWAGATDPKISAGLVLADRENASKSLQEFLDSAPKRTFTVAADSKDEAAAFVCAEIEKSPELRGRLIVVRKRVDNLFPIYNRRFARADIFVCRQKRRKRHRRYGLAIACHYRGFARRQRRQIRLPIESNLAREVHCAVERNGAFAGRRRSTRARIGAQFDGFAPTTCEK